MVKEKVLKEKSVYKNNTLYASKFFHKLYNLFINIKDMSDEKLWYNSYLIGKQLNHFYNLNKSTNMIYYNLNYFSFSNIIDELYIRMKKLNNYQLKRILASNSNKYRTLVNLIPNILCRTPNNLEHFKIISFFNERLIKRENLIMNEIFIIYNEIDKSIQENKKAFYYKNYLPAFNNLNKDSIDFIADLFNHINYNSIDTLPYFKTLLSKYIKTNKYDLQYHNNIKFSIKNNINFNCLNNFSISIVYNALNTDEKFIHSTINEVNNYFNFVFNFFYEYYLKQNSSILNLHFNNSHNFFTSKYYLRKDECIANNLKIFVLNSVSKRPYDMMFYGNKSDYSGVYYYDYSDLINFFNTTGPFLILPYNSKKNFDKINQHTKFHELTHYLEWFYFNDRFTDIFSGGCFSESIAEYLSVKYFVHSNDTYLQTYVERFNNLVNKKRDVNYLIPYTTIIHVQNMMLGVDVVSCEETKYDFHVFVVDMIFKCKDMAYKMNTEGYNFGNDEYLLCIERLNNNFYKLISDKNSGHFNSITDYFNLYY